MSSDKVSRRAWLRCAFVGGAGLLLAACGQPAAPTSAPAPPKPTEASKPTEAPKPAAAAPTQAPAGTAASPTAPPKPAGSASPAAAQPAAAKGPVTVRWWMGSRGDDLVAFGTSPRAYSAKNPNVTVEITGIADQGLTKVQTAIAAGDPPELVMVSDRAGTSGIFYAGGIQVLDDYIRRDKDFDVKQLEPITIGALRSPDGKQYAVADQLYVGSNFFYSPKMFRDKGLDPTKPPTTLDELEKTAALFDSRQGDQLAMVGFHPSAYHHSSVYVFAYGGKLFDAEKAQITPDDPGVVEGLEWLARWYRKYGVDNLRRLLAGYGQYQSAQNSLLAGQVAMTGFWDALVAYRNRYAPTVEYEHAWFPYAASHPEAKGFGLLNFNPAFIPAQAKAKDAAWDVLKFNSMDVDTVLETSILLANTPHNLGALTAPGAAKADPMLRKCWDYAFKGKMSYFPPGVPGAAEFNQEWTRQLDLILADKATVKDGVKQIKQVVQPIVDKTLRGGG
jgi:multiple sugar transport system substrate-binding protein